MSFEPSLKVVPRKFFMENQVGQAHDCPPDTTVSFSFIKDLELYRKEKLYYCDVPLDPAYESQRTNLHFGLKTVTARDIRSLEYQPSLPVNGFQILIHEVKAIIDNMLRPSEEAVQEYLKEIIDLLKEKFDTPHVFSYQYTVLQVLAQREQLCLPFGSFARTSLCQLMPLYGVLKGILTLQTSLV
jgi:hypothetical protein